MMLKKAFFPLVVILVVVFSRSVLAICSSATPPPPGPSIPSGPGVPSGPGTPSSPSAPSGPGSSSSGVCVDVNIGEIDQEGQVVLFTGNATVYYPVPENPVGPPSPPGDISSVIQWRSNVDGFLGTGREYTGSLSLGRHYITASAQYGSFPSYGSDSQVKSIFVREKFCAQETQSVAETTEEYYPLEIRNLESVPAKVYWISYSGERQYFGTVATGERLEVNGYPGNQWVVTTEHGDCVDVMSSGFEPSVYEVSFEH